MAEVKEIVRDAVVAHEAQEKVNYIGRIEFDAYRSIEAERFAIVQKKNDEQALGIRRNTILLERIALKIGVKREAGD